MNTEFELSDKKVKTKNWHKCLKWISVSDFSTLFFPTCNSLKTWFKFSRVKINTKDLKGNKNYCEFAGFLIYLHVGFELSRVKLQQMHEGNLGKFDFGSS